LALSGITLSVAFEEVGKTLPFSSGRAWALLLNILVSGLVVRVLYTQIESSFLSYYSNEAKSTFQTHAMGDLPNCKFFFLFKC
jgi:hypothetical protein